MSSWEKITLFIPADRETAEQAEIRLHERESGRVPKQCEFLRIGAVPQCKALAISLLVASP